jgi:hypothetical protein
LFCRQSRCPKIEGKERNITREIRSHGERNTSIAELEAEVEHADEVLEQIESAYY